jgi:hypothetical protein
VPASLQAFAAVGGIAGLVLFIFFWLFRGVATSLFAKLHFTQKDSYRLARLFMILTFLFALSCFAILAFNKAAPSEVAETGAPSTAGGAPTELFTWKEYLGQETGLGFSLRYPLGWYVSESMETVVIQPKQAVEDQFGRVEISFFYGNMVGFRKRVIEENEAGAEVNLDKIFADIDQEGLEPGSLIGRTVREIRVQDQFGDSPTRTDKLDVPIIETGGADEYAKTLYYVERDGGPFPADEYHLLEISCSAPRLFRQKASTICDNIFATIIIANPEYFQD